MPDESAADLDLFLHILQTVEKLNITYVVIGGFAANLYGITRTTYDIDIVVDLDEPHIQSLADAYPPPRYYADPYQMRYAMEQGSLFNIIDADQGQKADLFPVTMDPRYWPILARRIRQSVKLPGMNSFDIWTARPDDVIVGKLMALAELDTKRHESDIYELLVLHYAGILVEQDGPIDETYITEHAAALGNKVAILWEKLKTAALAEAERIKSS